MNSSINFRKQSFHLLMGTLSPLALGTLMAALALPYPAAAEDLNGLQLSLIGVSAFRAGKHLGCQFEIEAEAPWLESARLRTPSNEWFELEEEEENGLFSYSVAVSTHEELNALFPPGEYLFEIGRNGVITATVVQVPATLIMPTAAPQIQAPFYGQSDMIATNALIQWTSPETNDFMVIAIELDDLLDPSGEQFFFVPPSTTNYTFTNLSSNHLFQGGVYFGNVAEGTNADQASFFFARAKGSWLMFSTHPDREPLQPLLHATFRAGAINETQCLFDVILDFDRPIQPLDGDPLYETIRLETPTGDETWLHAIWWQSEMGTQLFAQGGSTNLSDLNMLDGLNVISFWVNSNNAICTPFLLLHPQAQTPLQPPEQFPEILAPASGILTTKTVSLSWAPVSDPSVTGIYARLGGNSALLSTNEVSWGPVQLPPGMHGATVAFWNDLLNLPNPDNIPYDMMKYLASEHTFEVGHRLVYEAGTGGAIWGNATQLVSHGHSGDPVLAYATDWGAIFHAWSDGWNTPDRTDTNVAADLTLRASFLSPNGAELDWYAARGIFPAPGEGWGDVDQRPVPAKGTTLLQENIADTDPDDPNDLFRIHQITAGPPPTITLFWSSPIRMYRLLGCDNLSRGEWFPIPGAGPLRSWGGEINFQDFGLSVSQRFYRIEVSVP